MSRRLSPMANAALTCFGKVCLFHPACGRLSHYSDGEPVSLRPLRLISVFRVVTGPTCEQKATFPKNRLGLLAGLVDRKEPYDIIQWGFQESFGMKKTYEKPSLVKKGRLTAIVAQQIASPINGNAPA